MEAMTLWFWPFALREYINEGGCGTKKQARNRLRRRVRVAAPRICNRWRRSSAGPGVRAWAPRDLGTQEPPRVGLPSSSDCGATLPWLRRQEIPGTPATNERHGRVAPQ